MLGLVARDEPTLGVDDPPPGKTGTRRGESGTDAACRAGPSGERGDLAVGHDVTRRKAGHHLAHA